MSNSVPKTESSTDLSGQQELDLIPPEIIHDGNKQYKRGPFLAKGGFAKCYELTDMDTKKTYAGKIMSIKHIRSAPALWKAFLNETNIHRELKHINIVCLHACFLDQKFSYFVLELCRKETLNDLIESRGAVTEPEARYFMHQLLLGVQYFHKNNIIHRDIKCSNLLLNDNMEIKIADFGFATKLQSARQRTRTYCGTLKVMAPEIYKNDGHSLEVDIWSMGCVLYKLLVGKSPFCGGTEKEIENKILNNRYSLPAVIGPLARRLIMNMLHEDPTRRPTVDEVLNDEFFSRGDMPAHLPLSCLTTAPQFDLNTHMISVRRPLGEINREIQVAADARDKIVTLRKNESMKENECVLTVVSAVAACTTPLSTAD